MGGQLSVIEGKVLSAGVVALLNTKSLCSRMSDGRYKIRCGDGSRVKVSENDLIDLNNKIISLANGVSLSSDEINRLKGVSRG